MRVIVKVTTEYDKEHPVSVFKPKKTTQYVETLRELWEREYNSYDPEPIRGDSWFEENRAVISNGIKTTEFYITTVAEVEL